MASLRVLTTSEAAVAIEKLTGRPCSARRVRHLLVQCGIGTELQARRRGETRLFSVLDLAFLKLAVELERQGISSWVTRVVLTYQRKELILALRSLSHVALAVTGLKGSVEPALKARPGGTAAWVPLREIWRGLEAEVADIRAAKPTVWMWRDVPVHVVKRSTV